MIKRLLKRILSDEQSHRGKFERLMAKAKRESLKDLRGKRKDSVTKTLDWGIAHEYTASCNTCSIPT
jgi:bacterioferritin